MNDSSSPTAPNGRTGKGSFGPGNKYAKGNPFANRVTRLRSALYKAVSPADLHDVLAALLAQAKAGDVASIKELLQRLLGPPESVDLMQRLDALESKLEQVSDNKRQPWLH
ncbi:MAG TPA: hypothetical protein VH518_25260 [Tepidisphaeraceae bacterium]|jgi:hypothetical protein